MKYKDLANRDADPDDLAAIKALFERGRVMP
jgi:hypothetical protein